jgi:uncharacterized membrane protein
MKNNTVSAVIVVFPVAFALAGSMETHYYR